MANNEGRGHFGAMASTTQVGGMLGHRQPQSEVFDELQKTQKEHGKIDDQSIRRIAIQTRTSEASVRGVASFYSLFDVGETSAPRDVEVRVCDGPSCRLRGSDELILDCRKVEGDAHVGRSSCLGYCEQAPVMLVDRANGERVVAIGVSNSASNSCPQPLIVTPACTEMQSIGHPSPDLLRRPLTKRFGVVDPLSIDAALSTDAYLALVQALDTDRTKIIQTVEESGLRGRGGAGFNTGRKWRIAANSDADCRYVVCNADESEPGTFKDRMLIENDPHALLEGMAICALAIGAQQGLIYIRGEYVEPARILEHAIEEARDRGFLGQDIQGSGFSFDVRIHRGAGAYVCGEESALLESLEGKRGEPRDRPPFPSTSGFCGKPTVVNNVETLCSIPSIVHEGAQHYRRLGRGNAAGTKLFCLSGHVTRPGLCEAPMGVSLGQVIQEFGGGIRDDGEFKFALTGGAAGTFVPQSLIDIPLAYDSWSEGVAIGSGAIIVADQSVNAAEMLLWVLEFFEHESCGKCTPCRVGTVQAREILQKIVGGDGGSSDVDQLSRLAKTIGTSSFCGLGQSIAWPIESAIKYFRSDFENG